jgi:hypothetical protein
MDKSGLVLAADTDYVDRRSVRFVSGASTIGFLRAKAPVGATWLTLESQAVTGAVSYCEVIAHGATGNSVAAVLKAAPPGGGPAAEVQAYVNWDGSTRVDLRGSTVAVIGGLLCTPYDDEVGLGDGIVYGREGVAAGEDQKIWQLGGYTGQAATATGHVWVRIDGVLRKLLAA